MNAQQVNSLHEKLGQLGIEKDSQKVLQSMLNGKKSDLVNLHIGGEKMPSFLGVYKKPDGSFDIKVHPNQIRNDFNLSAKHLEKLNTGQLVSYQDKIYQKDRHTGELLHIDISKINIPEKLENYKLNDSQKSDLLSGKKIQLNGKRIGLDLNDMKGYSVTLSMKEGIRNEQSIRR